MKFPVDWRDPIEPRVAQFIADKRRVRVLSIIRELRLGRASRNVQWRIGAILRKHGWRRTKGNIDGGSYNYFTRSTA